MVQKKYSIHEKVAPVVVQADKPDSVIQSEGYEVPLTWKNPKRPQYAAAAAVTIGAFSLGNVLGWSSPALPSVEKSGHFPNLVTSDLSWIGSLITV